MPPGVRLRCAAQIADAVEYIHVGCKWLIRDLKTANVLVWPDSVAGFVAKRPSPARARFTHGPFPC